MSRIKLNKRDKNMLSRAEVKYIDSLKHKKYRQKYNNFVAEGHKLVKDIILSNGIKPIMLVCTKLWNEENYDIVAPHQKVVRVMPQYEINKITGFMASQPVFMIAEIPKDPDDKPIESSINLMLEDIQDPGNLGTLIRAADWFGLKKIYCSNGCADTFNPKVVQSAMGSVGRVGVYRNDLMPILEKYNDLKVYGATMTGNSVYTNPPPDLGFLVIGNEGRGISAAIMKHIDEQVTIPGFGSAESLNAAIAGSILLSHIKMQTSLNSHSN